MTTATRIGINIMFLVFGVLMMAQLLGLFPDGMEETLKSRVSLSESIAVQCSIAANRNRSSAPAPGEADRQAYREILTILKSMVRRNPDVLSAGVRRQSKLVLAAGPHRALWDQQHGSQAEFVSVPVTKGESEWATVEISYTPIYTSIVFLGIETAPLWLSLISITCAAGFGAILYYSRVFNETTQEDESVPSRVRSALDSLSDGLLVLNEDAKIVFANRAFEDATGVEESQLLGRMVSELDWSTDWDELIAKDVAEDEARKITLRTPIGNVDFTVGASEILDDNGNTQGKLICFNDVTILEKRKEELLYAMRSLQSSRDMIKEQNEQLKVLATRDPLTNCWNRRSFFEEFYPLWTASRDESRLISAVMLDIDHFKSVNDNHGHAMGDEVLKKVSTAILETSRPTDIVCRYGGEEFCILLPDTSLIDAKHLAERFRKKIEALQFDQLSVTASQGISCSSLRASEPEEMLEQADQALYVAKNSGRNRVVTFNEVPADYDLQKADGNTRKVTREGDSDETRAIPFQVVSSMISVLSHRDPATAAHCVRVADLSFAVGQGLLSASELYALEVGALLHDIGKIAVPDSLLLKPEKLTENEIQSLRQHSRIGCELVEAAFEATSVVDTVRYAGCPYEGKEQFPGMLKGEQIPITARIVTIADAYDSMVSDSIYRQGLSREKAIDELYKHAGKQFDPRLVERLVDVLNARPKLDADTGRKVQFSKEFAIQLAYISEQITKSFDEQDFDLLRANAQKLEAAANQFKDPKLKIIAVKLINHSMTGEGKDVELNKIMSDVVQLLELCHSAQREFLSAPEAIVK